MTILVLSLIVIGLMIISSHFYKENKRMKVDVGYDYYAMIQSTGSMVSSMGEVDLNEALQTEHGKKLIETFRGGLYQAESNFLFSQPAPISDIGLMFNELIQLLNKALEQKKVSNEDIEIYKEHVRKLTLILMDLEHYVGSKGEIFDMFHGKVPHEIVDKINQRLEGDY